MTLWRKLQVPGLAAIIVFYLVHVRLLDGRLQDDAFISFRYARNLAEGTGLVFNPAERVEGITNFLWTILLAVPFLFSKAADPVIAARALAIASGAGTLVASFLLVRRLAPKNDVLPLCAPLLLAGSWPFAINTMTGLETVFFGGLLTVTALLLITEQEDLRYRGSSVVCALAALTRPEATGLFVSWSLAVAFALRGRGPDARRYLLRLVVPFTAIVGAHEVFRLAYYGQLVPNTYFAKAGSSLPQGGATPGEYVANFVTKGLPPFGVFSALAALFVVARAREPWARIIFIGALFGFVNILVSGADFMIGYRYFVPYVPLLLVAAALGGGWLVERLRDSPNAFRLEAALMVVAMFVSSRGLAHSRDKLRPFEQLRRRIAADTNEALGRWMAEHVPPGTRIATVDIGEIGYWSGLPILDLSGLTDPKIARRPGDLLDRQLDLDDVFGRGLGGFVFTTRQTGPPAAHGNLAAYWPPGSSRALLTDPRMEEGYVFVARYPSYRRLSPAPDGTWEPIVGRRAQEGDRDNTHFLELYLRKDIAAGLSPEQPDQNAL